MSQIREAHEREEQYNARLLKLEERVLELTQRLDNAVGKLVSLAQLVRDSTAAHVSLAAQLSRLESQLERHMAEPPAPRLSEPPAAVEPETVVPQPQPEADFAQIVALLKSEDPEQARRVLGRMTTPRLQENPALLSLVEAALNVHNGDLSAVLDSLQVARSHCSDPRLEQAIHMAEARLSALD